MGKFDLFIPSSCSLLWGHCMWQETILEKYLLLSIVAPYFFTSQVNLPMLMCNDEAKKLCQKLKLCIAGVLC